MRIAFVIPYFYPALGYGGTPRLAYELARALCHRGHQVTVLTTDAGGQDRISSEFIRNIYSDGLDGIQVHYYRNFSNALARRHRIFLPTRCFRDIRSRLADCDVIHVHDLRSFLSVASHRAARSLGIPYVLSPHGGLQRLGKASAKAVFDLIWGRAILRDAAGLCAVSPLEEHDAAIFGLDRRRIYALPPAIDADQFSEPCSRGSFASRWGIQNRKIILFLGRLHWIKGADILVEAIACLPEVADLHLVIAGPDDGEENDLRSLVKAKRLEHKVTFTGVLDGAEKLAALCGSSGVVLPSRREGFPLTVLEALVCETPVVLTSACDLGAWVQGQVGIVSFRSEDAEDLARKLKMILGAPPDRKAMADTRNFVLKEFCSDAIAARAERLYGYVAGHG